MFFERHLSLYYTWVGHRAAKKRRGFKCLTLRCWNKIAHRNSALHIVSEIAKTGKHSHISHLHNANLVQEMADVKRRPLHFFALTFFLLTLLLSHLKIRCQCKWWQSGKIRNQMKACSVLADHAAITWNVYKAWKFKIIYDEGSSSRMWKCKLVISLHQAIKLTMLRASEVSRKIINVPGTGLKFESMNGKLDAAQTPCLGLEQLFLMWSESTV